MKNLLQVTVVLYFFCFTQIINAQFYQEWVSRYNGTGNREDISVAIAKDVLGNIYVTGYTKIEALNEDYLTIKYSPSGVFQWAMTYNFLGSGSSYDNSYDIATDLLGNVYVTGSSRGNGTGNDIVTIKYNTNGVQQWVQRYNGNDNGNDAAYSIAVDNSGNVYITGESKDFSHNQDFCTIKYNTNGVQQWIAIYNGTGNSDDIARSLAIDDSGNVYVTGVAGGSGTNSDFCTIKYNSNGVQKWVQYYNGQPGYNVDEANAICVDDSCNVYVTGKSNGSSYPDYDYATIKYNKNGIQQWVKRYNGTGYNSDIAWGITVDSLGNVYITGESMGSSTNLDYATIKYNLNGTQLWVARFNSSVNDVDIAYAIVLDSAFNIYVTGQSSGNNTNRDFATIKYNSSGVQQWEARYNGPANSVDHGKALLIGENGNVFVTGLSRGINTLEDFATLKYIQSPLAPSNLSALAVSTNKINLNWIDKSGNEIGFRIERSTNTGVNWNLIKTTEANVIAYSDTGLIQNTIYYYRICAFNQAGNSVYSNIAYDTTFILSGLFIKNEIPKKNRLYQNAPNPFNPATSIRFEIAKSENVKIIIYDMTGRKISTVLNKEMIPGNYIINWDGEKYPSGIYFYCIETESFKDTKKMILLK